MPKEQQKPKHMKYCWGKLYLKSYDDIFKIKLEFRSLVRNGHIFEPFFRLNIGQKP